MRNLPIGFNKVPWGFIQNNNGSLTATTSVKERNQRAELGEFAIGLLASLGISEERLLKLIGKPNPLENLKIISPPDLMPIIVKEPITKI